MIKAFYQEDIVNRLGAIFTYGLNKSYSFKAIEEKVAATYFIDRLENNEYDIESKIEEIVEETFNIKLNETVDISFKGLFIAESYFKLFLFFNRSFEYLFLYWPLEEFVNKYSLYHEMDFSNLRKDFDLKRQQTSLLKELCLERNIKLSEISKLTGLNINTLKRYNESDKYLNVASYEAIHCLSSLFKVKENIFSANLNVYLDQSIYLSDKSNDDYRNYLGLYYANYFDSRINEKEATYDKKNNCFILKDATKLKVMVEDPNNLKLSSTSSMAGKDTYLVIIRSSLYDEKMGFEYLKDINAMEVMIITQENVYLLKKGQKKEITDTINRSLIVRAKQSSLKK